MTAHCICPEDRLQVGGWRCRALIIYDLFLHHIKNNYNDVNDFAIIIMIIIIRF